MKENTWCPECNQVQKIVVKGYYLLGEKKRDDYYCSKCNTKVIPSCKDDDQYQKSTKKAKHRKSIEALLFILVEFGMIPIIVSVRATHLDVVIIF